MMKRHRPLYDWLGSRAIEVTAPIVQAHYNMVDRGAWWLHSRSVGGSILARELQQLGLALQEQQLINTSALAVPL